MDKIKFALTHNVTKAGLDLHVTNLIPFRFNEIFVNQFLPFTVRNLRDYLFHEIAESRKFICDFIKYLSQLCCHKTHEW